MIDLNLESNATVVSAIGTSVLLIWNCDGTKLGSRWWRFCSHQYLPYDGPLSLGSSFTFFPGWWVLQCLYQILLGPSQPQISQTFGIYAFPDLPHFLKSDRRTPSFIYHFTILRYRLKLTSLAYRLLSSSCHAFTSYLAFFFLLGYLSITNVLNGATYLFLGHLWWQMRRGVWCH